MGILSFRKQAAERSASAAQPPPSFDRFFDIALDMFCIAGPDCFFKQLNPAFSETLGWSLEELKSRPFTEFVHPDDLEPTMREVERQVAEGKEVLNFENRYRHKDGSWRVISWRSLPQPGGYMCAVARDVTELRKAQRKLEVLNRELESRVAERTREIATQLERLRALRKIDLAILGSVDLRVVLEVFLSQVTEQLRVDAASVLLVDPVTGNLNYAAGKGFRSGAIGLSSVPIGKGYAGRVARDRIRVQCSLLDDKDFCRPEVVREDGFQTYIGLPLFVKGRVKGVLDIFHRGLFEPDEDWLAYADTLAGQAAIAIDGATMFLNLEQSHAEVSHAYDATLEGWGRALDLRDNETEGHSQRVTELTVRLARRMGYPEGEMIHLRRGALLHDIGKIGIPDSILLKPAKLDDEERAIMERHPTYALEWLSPIRYLAPALEIPYGHHERWDGTGYPRGLQGEAIPLSARMFAVVDVWDALRSDRPYRKAWSVEKVLEHIREGSGSHFDPAVVEAFMAMMLEGNGGVGQVMQEAA